MQTHTRNNGSIEKMRKAAKEEEEEDAMAFSSWVLRGAACMGRPSVVMVPTTAH